MLRTFILALTVGVFAFVGGCKSDMMSPTTQTAMSAPPERALLITSGQGSVVYLPSSGPEKVMMLSTSGDMPMCAQCKADAIKYMETGEVPAETCPVCGAKRKPLVIPMASTGHQ